MEQKIIQKIRQIIQYFETGKIKTADYGAVAIFHDGPGNRKQLTVGASQTTEYGHLKSLIRMYVAAEGKYWKEFKAYLPGIGDLKTPTLADNASFIALFKAAANDPVMQKTQDDFFNLYYLHPAQQWFEKNGFALPLSLLVIYDSYVHSGSIMDFLRQNFAEKVPAVGGDEKAWILAYVNSRDKWLENNTARPILQNTDYRTDSFIYAIRQGNWNLDKPFKVVNYKSKEETDVAPIVQATIE